MWGGGIIKLLKNENNTAQVSDGPSWVDFTLVCRGVGVWEEENVCHKQRDQWKQFIKPRYLVKCIMRLT